PAAHHRRGGAGGSSAGSSLGGDAYELASPATGRLDTVPETDDSWTTPMPPYYAAAAHNEEEEEDEEEEGRMQTYATAVTGGLLSPPRQATHASSAKTQKRVSIPTPPLPAASAFASVNTGLPPSRSSYGQQQRHGDQSAALPQQPLPVAEDDDQGSTAIHSRRSLAATGLTYPVEVKRRALATYVLELGIALHSVLIGLALAISDRGFLALFLAVCFHQFFEGLALGTSLAELYWIKAQIAAQFRASEELHAIDSESLLAMPSERCHKISLSSSAAAAAMNTSSSYHVVNVNVVGSTTFSSNA
ncbi:hypothetical protein IWW47_006562, partial [Coemansia sp. RSA 2052]